MKIDKNLIIRSISGIFLVAILLTAILYSESSCFLILALIAVAATYELLSNINKNSPITTLTWFASALAALVCNLFYLSIDTRLIVIIIFAVIMIRMIAEMYRKESNPLQSIGYELFAIIYSTVPMLMLFQMSSNLIVALFIMVWSNDVGAYLVGVSCGKHKLWERLSPKKSWEGFAGGVIATIIAAVVIGINRDQSPYLWGIMAIFVSIAAVYGDLFESMFKRSLKIKDSGNIIPGHGGVLDRFDAIFFAAPIFYMIYTYIF